MLLVLKCRCVVLGGLQGEHPHVLLFSFRQRGLLLGSPFTHAVVKEKCACMRCAFVAFVLAQSTTVMILRPCLVRKLLVYVWRVCGIYFRTEDYGHDFTTFGFVVVFVLPPSYRLVPCPFSRASNMGMIVDIS